MSLAIGNLPVIRAPLCVRYRFRYSACTRCSDGCPAGALAVGDEGVTIDAALCSGCGLCAVACPTATFHFPSFPTSALVRPQAKALTLSCSPCGQEGDLRIPCLGDIEAPLLAGLALHGVSVTLLGADHCASCGNAPQGGARVESLLAGMRMLGEYSPEKWCAPTIAGMSANTDHQADRRQLFRRLTNRAVETMRGDRALEEIPEKAIRAAAPFVPPRRRLAEQLLERLAPLPDDSLLSLLLGVADVEQGEGLCTGCDVCARVCPTGALRVLEAQSRWELLYRSSQCVGCGVCIEACAADALRLQHRWRREGEGPTALQTLHRYRCERCGRFFIGLDNDNCPVCQDDQDSFAAIFG